MEEKALQRDWKGRTAEREGKERKEKVDRGKKRREKNKEDMHEKTSRRERKDREDEVLVMMKGVGGAGRGSIWVNI